MIGNQPRTGLFYAALLWSLGTSAVADSAATSNQLLKLNQWDWQQAIKAPRQGFLERNKEQAPQQQQRLQDEMANERQNEQQLYERQRRERTATTRTTSPGTPAAHDARRAQQQQTQRFKAETDNLRLQQDIQRRAMDNR